MKRIAYVGLSTPLLYDYKTQVQKAPADVFDSPNPILDSPYGLLLLYDEIWFLSRSLCPVNMRGLDYVRFLDEQGKVDEMSELVRPDPKKIFSEAALDAFDQRLEEYSSACKRTGIYWEAAPDNHTHVLKISGSEAFGNSKSIENVLIDLAVLSRIADVRVEFITNGFTQTLFESQSNIYGKLFVYRF